MIILTTLRICRKPERRHPRGEYIYSMVPGVALPGRIKSIQGARVACTTVLENIFLNFSLHQGCHMLGKSQGKTKLSPGQGIVRNFF